MPGTAQNGVRMYQCIRRYLTKIYLYGFLSRKDFEQLDSVSLKSYDAEIKLIKQIFREEGFNKIWGQLSIGRRYETSGNDRLQDSYMLSQLDLEDMAEYLHILNIARHSPGSGSHFAKQLQLQELPRRALGTIYNRLDYLCRYGCLERQGKCYRLAQDGLEQLTDDQLQQLYEYARFCSRTVYPRMASSALCRTLSRKLAARGICVSERSSFLLRHHTNFHVLDEELVYLLGEAMQAKQWVYFDDRLRLPLILRVDTKLGRWYAICADEQGHFSVERLANVKQIQHTEKEEAAADWEALRRAAEQAYRHVLFSGYNRQPVWVRARLVFGEHTGLRNQFIREIRIGAVTEREGEQYYEALVSDPWELKPLLRAYGAYLQILPGEHDLQSDLQKQYTQMLEDLGEDEG